MVNGQKRNNNKEITVDDLAIMIKETIADKMATKEDLRNLREEMATKEDLRNLREEMATKNDLAGVKAELKSFKEEMRNNFEEINEKLNLVIEDVAHHSERIENLEEKIS